METEYLGCGDHGCIFGHPGGMGTNGGCHCLDDARDASGRGRLREKIVALRKERDLARFTLAKIVGDGKGWEDKDGESMEAEIRAALGIAGK